MRHSFIGDIGDFSNNGLLRAICGKPESPVPGLRLGVVWYLNDDPNGPDGNRIDYINASDSNNKSYPKCDPELYKKLQQLVGESIMNGEKRNIHQIETGNVLPANTQYYSKSIRNTERGEWLDNALKEIENADILFLNPDNGIASKNQQKSPAHATMAEIKRFFDAGKSLIIYQHLGQGTGPAEKLIDTTVADLRQELQLGDTQKVWVFRWHRISSRLYFVVAHTQEHSVLIERRLQGFRESPWFEKGHFSEVQV